MLKTFRNVVAETYTDLVRCKYCGKAINVVRYGTSKDQQNLHLLCIGLVSGCQYKGNR